MVQILDTQRALVNALPGSQAWPPSFLQSGPWLEVMHFIAAVRRMQASFFFPFLLVESRPVATLFSKCGWYEGSRRKQDDPSSLTPAVLWKVQNVYCCITSICFSSAFVAHSCNSYPNAPIMCLLLLNLLCI